MDQLAEKLQKPFDDSDIEWRIQQVGKSANGSQWGMVLAYVTNRAIQTRLDEVFGVSNWKNDYKPAPDGGILCGISFYDNEKKEWITKWDGAENTNIEAVKGGLSGAMKRAAVQLGIGRWLYKLDAVFVSIVPEKNDRNKKNYVNDSKKGVKGYWETPLLGSKKKPELKIETPPKKTPIPKDSPDDTQKKKEIIEKLSALLIKQVNFECPENATKAEKGKMFGELLKVYSEWENTFAETIGQLEKFSLKRIQTIYGKIKKDNEGNLPEELSF